MPIITVATSKGGAGKTTLARLLLGLAAHEGFTPAVLDTDNNGTLADWVANMSQLAVTVRAEPRDASRILPVVSELTEEHDFIVIDTAGAALEATAYAMSCADIVLIPVGVNAADVVEANKTMRLFEQVREQAGTDVLARVVFTAFKPRTTLGHHIEEQVAELKLPTLRTKLMDLIAIREMSFSGDVPMGGAVGLQVSNFFDEVMELVPADSRAKRAA